MSIKKIIALGAFNMVLAIALGAYSAHGLPKVAAPAVVASFQTGVTYHIYHSLALLIWGIVAFQYRRLPVTGVAVLFLSGILLFSVAIYVISFCKIQGFSGALAFLGPLPPFGAFCWLLGWGVTGLRLWRYSEE